MANAVYATGKDYMVQTAIDWDNDDYRISGVTSGYVFAHGHTNMTSVVPFQLSYSTATLPGKGTVLNTTDGRVEYTSSPATLLAITGTVSAVVVYRHIGADASNIPIAYLDNFTPIVSNGGDSELTPSGGSWFYV